MTQNLLLGVKDLKFCGLGIVFIFFEERINFLVKLGVAESFTLVARKDFADLRCPSRIKSTEDLTG